MVLSFNSEGQNLVPNGTFNYADTCTSGSLFAGIHAEPWFATYASPNFLHPCKPIEFSVPQNDVGYQAPYLGEGYLGLYNFSWGQNHREFYTVQLSEELASGISYRVGLHISLADSCNYATNRMGIALTQNEPANDLISLLNQTPQVENHEDSMLTDKLRWARIERSFVATGGERFLTIGNFHNDSDTDTVTLDYGGTPPPNNSDLWNIAYYYVDNVSVVPDSVYLSGIDLETDKASVKLYPNPNAGHFGIDLRLANGSRATLQLWDVSGKLIGHRRLLDGLNELEFDVSHGLYLYTITVNDKALLHQKLVVIHAR